MAKIISVEEIDGGVAYDLFVPSTNNFFLANGSLVSNSGKTFFARGLTDRAYLAGHQPFHPSDVKNEMASSRKPVQDKFARELLTGEQRCGIPVVGLRPTVFADIDDKTCPDGNVWCPTDPSLASRSDFQLLVNFKRLSEPMKIAADLLYDAMREAFQKSESSELFSFTKLDELIDGLPDLDVRQKRGFKLRLKPLYTSNIFVEKFRKGSVKDLLLRRCIPAVNMARYDEFGRDNFAYPEVIFTINLRTALNLRRQKLIPRLLVFVDEGPRFIPADDSKNPPSKELLLESVDTDTAYGVDYLICTQELDLLPQRFIKQTRYFFLPYSCSPGSLSRVLWAAGLVRYTQSAPNSALRLMRKMKKFDWLAVDRVKRTLTIIRPLAPRSFHKESQL